MEKEELAGPHYVPLNVDDLVTKEPAQLKRTV